jgi:DNA-binding CsgD family transcriptional regulator
MISDDQILALVAAKDLDGLIDAAFRVLQSAVASDFVSAFYRSSSKGLLKERDSRGRRYSPAFMRRSIELNPAIPLAMASRGVKILATRTGLPPDGELRKLPFYREIMQRQGWRHAVALCFWGNPPADLPVFVASVYRAEGRRDFSPAEIARLRSIHPFIDNAVSRLHQRATAKSAWDSLALTVRARALGFAILDSNLCLVEANGVARRLCAAWVDDVSRRTRGSLRAWRLPPALEQACTELRSEWQSQLQVNPDAAVLRRRSGILHPRRRDVAASITMVCRNADSLSDPSFVVELERIGKADAHAPVLQRLTTAERVVAMALMDGRSNQEIADHLAKSVAAVKFLLHRVYEKTGVASRAALVAALRV